MKERKRRIFIWMGISLGIVLIFLATAVVVVATLDWNKAKPYLSAAVSKATGRQLNIEGNLSVDWGWLTKVRAEQIQFENASWSKHPRMVELGLFEAEIDLWRLVREWRAVVPTVSISQLKLILEKNAEGAANWEFRAAPAVTEPVVPEKRGNFAIIEKLLTRDSAVLFVNQETKARFDLKLTTAEGRDFGSNRSSSRRRALIKVNGSICPLKEAPIKISGLRINLTL